MNGLSANMDIDIGEMSNAQVMNTFASEANTNNNADTDTDAVDVPTPSAGDDEDGGEDSISIHMQNIVATVNLGRTVNLTDIATKARNAEYNPKRFQAVIMRIRDPKTTALVFASGKMIVTGAKYERDSEIAAKKYTQIIQKVGQPVTFSAFKIQNMTATCDVGFPIRLEGLVYGYSAYATYEPELFPGLIYRLPDPKVVILIFVSGKLVLTGAKEEDSLTTALDTIFPILEEFRKRTTLIRSGQNAGTLATVATATSSVTATAANNTSSTSTNNSATSTSSNSS